MNSLLTILLLACGLTSMLLVFARPYLAFVAIVLMYALEQLGQSYFVYLQAHQQFFNIAIGILALVAVFLRILRRDVVTSGLNNGVTYLVAAQFLLWLVAAFYSPAKDFAQETIAATWPYLVLYVVVLPLLIKDLKELGQSLIAIMVVGSVLAVLIMASPVSSYAGGRLRLDLGMGADSRAATGNPLAIAELGGTMALIAALIAPVRGRAAFTVLRVVAFVLGLGLAIGSGSRGQVLATVVAGIMFYPMARRINNPRNFILTGLGLGVLVAGIYFTFGLFIGDQNRARWDVGQMVADIALRFDMCWDLLSAWLAAPESWIFGLGTNAYAHISGGSAARGYYVHNVAVEILCEHGIVGAAIFVAMMVLTVRAGIALWRAWAEDPMQRSVAAVFMAICAFALFNALKQGSISSIAPFYFWLVLSKVARHEQLCILSAGDLPEFDGADALSTYVMAPGYATARLGSP